MKTLNPMVQIQFHVLACFLFIMSGCATQEKLMDASYVSMTQTHLPEGRKLRDLGIIRGEFCTDVWHQKGSFGFFDEVLRTAQTQSGADYLMHASFFRDGNCYSVEGTGMKLLETNGSSSPTKVLPIVQMSSGGGVRASETKQFKPGR